MAIHTRATQDPAEPLSLLAGDWAGSGRGEYPTIAPFEFLETLQFRLHETRQILHYEQQARRRDLGGAEYIPSHWESGFIRQVSDDAVEVVNAQGNGRLEMLSGSLKTTPRGLVLRLRSIGFMNDPRMQEAERTFTLDGNELHYTLKMRTTTVQRSALHVEAHLKRSS